MRPHQRHLAIFLKQPRIGQVKSRLARDIGRPAAWRFYRGLVRKTVPPLVADPRWTTFVVTTPNNWQGREPLWHFNGNRIAQGSGDLGARMLRVFRILPPGPAIIVGSDIPALRPSHIALGFEALGHSDVVVGPATDGGYWLIGLSARGRVLNPFNDVHWSTPKALTQTLCNVPKAFRIGLVDRLADIDDKSDWLTEFAEG